MPTVPSWAELRTAPGQVRALVGLRAAVLGPSGRRRAAGAFGLVGALTVLAVVAPAFAPGLDRSRAGDVLALLPSLCAGFLVLSIVSAVVTGGGRELLPREQSVAFPLSTVTEYAGSLLLAPLNIAWLLQVWTLLAAGGFALHGRALLPTEVLLLAWVVLATVVGQLAGWVVEGVRRTPYGRVLLGGAAAALLAAAGVAVLGHHVTGLLDRLPAGPVLGTILAGADGRMLRWTAGVAALLLIALAAAALGTVATATALQRPERAELRLESGGVRARPDARTALAAAIRVERASVWRSVPLRRGLLVLALLPGVLALTGALPWSTLCLLPGLVASGAGLLFGVNAWCLDGRGVLWRESLPLPPRVAYLAKALVLGEVLAGSAVVTALLAVVRAGRPAAAPVLALAAVTAVVCLQVLGACLRWSVARPFHSDLRSARATPAPPLAMVGYSARLALSTTVTAMVFSAAGSSGEWRVPLLLLVAMGSWSGLRLCRDARAWDDPVTRARVAAVVAG